MDPAQLESMIKTNVHPYVYMTKPALNHFRATRDQHMQKNAMIYVSSSVVYMNGALFGPYTGTKTHNLVFANQVRNMCFKNANFNGLMSVQTVHPLGVTTGLNNYKTDMPFVEHPSECARGSLCDLENRREVAGAFMHNVLLMLQYPLFGLNIPYFNKNMAKSMENDRDII